MIEMVVKMVEVILQENIATQDTATHIWSRFVVLGHILMLVIINVTITKAVVDALTTRLSVIRRYYVA